MFSITDGDGKALYFFQESISPAAQQNSFWRSSSIPFIRFSVVNLGAGAVPTTVSRRHLFGVDEFVTKPGPSRPNLRRLRTGGR